MGSLSRALIALSLLVPAAQSPQVFSNLHGSPEHPFESEAHARVFLFVRTDCPISNRYAPELQRLADEFKGRYVDFWLVYSDHAESSAKIRQQIADYKLPGIAILDPKQELARRAEAKVSPQAAVFNHAGQLLYSGRIDDRYADFGKSRTAASTHDLESAITATLEGKPIAHARTRAVGCYLADVK